MATNRIQKLLFSEYSDFEDIVLVESPFAETSRHGKGIRQVQIGLTPTKLILASYHVETLDDWSEDKQRYLKTQDPDIESFELVSAYPVECVNLSVFRHRSRQTLKARFCNGKILYYEIGGWQERKMLWGAWCERIKFLSPYESGTSVSETSVASSSSSSCSLYITRSSLSVSKTGRPTLWCHYAFSSSCDDAKIPGSWVDPHLYLGPQFFEKGINFMSLPEMGKQMTTSSTKIDDQDKISHKRKSRLELSARHEEKAGEAVTLWESQRGLMRRKIHRSYGLTPYPYLLAGLGLTTLSGAQTFSVQGKRSASEVRSATSCERVNNQLTLPRSQLVRTVSLEALDVPAICSAKLLRLPQDQPRRPVKFWMTPEEESLQWSLKQYKLQRRHLRSLRKSSSCHTPGFKQKKRRNKKLRSNLTQRVTTREEDGLKRHSGGGDSCPGPTTMSCPCLKLSDRQSGAVDTTADGVDKLPSSSLAHQLTLIDKQLMLQVTSFELSRLRKGKSSCRAPHLRALVSFSHRVSCLVASQVLNGTTVRDRAMLIVKYVGVAYKCHTLHSLQSAESVLRGLQSPAVYRLRHSWAYVRKHHASKYRRFEDLSRRYQDPRMLLYQRTFDNLSRTAPFLPSASLLVAVLLRNLPEMPKVKSSKFSKECSCSCKSGSRKALADSLPKSVRRFLSALTVYPPSLFTSKLDQPQPSVCQSETHLHALSNETTLENLDKFFSPASSPGERRVMQDVEFFLETCQAAALRYAIRTSPRVRDFLLNYPYQDLEDLFKISVQLESSSASE